jgi:hypothetical protein
LSEANFITSDEIVLRYGPDKSTLCRRFACWVFDDRCSEVTKLAATMAGALPGDLVVHTWDRNAEGIALKSLSGFRGVYCPRSSQGLFLFFAPLQSQLLN